MSLWEPIAAHNWNVLAKYINRANFQLTLMLQVFYLPWLVDIAGPNYGLVLELDRSGRITRSFHDPTGSVVPGHISEVYDDGGRLLYLGSYQSPFLGKLKLKD